MFKIAGIVDKQLISDAKKSTRDYTHFHSSEWYKCHRKIAYAYYEAKGFIKLDESVYKFDPQLERIFDNGHFTHDRWRKYLEKTNALMGRWECQNWMAHEKPKIFGLENKLGILKPDKCECGSDRFIYHEVGFYDEETMWGGHVDAVMDLSLLDLHSSAECKYLIIDFKTMNPFQFKKLAEPLPEHIVQMQIYLYLSGLRVGNFLYEDKGCQAVKEYIVEINEELIAEKKKEALRLKGILHHSADGRHYLPERGYDSRGHQECLRCKFRGHCWKGVQ